MIIEKIKESDKENITVVFVEAVMMPNGELINFGKTIGWVKDYKERHLYKEAKK